VDDAAALGGGAIAGAASSIITQQVLEHQNIDWNQVAGAAIGGAVTAEIGLYAVPSGGPLGGVVAGEVGGATGDLVTQGLYNLEGKQAGIKGTSLAGDTLVGGFFALIPGGDPDNLLWNTAEGVAGGGVTDLTDDLLSDVAYHGNVSHASTLLRSSTFTGTTAPSIRTIPVCYVAGLANIRQSTPPALPLTQCSSTASYSSSLLSTGTSPYNLPGNYTLPRSSGSPAVNNAPNNSITGFVQQVGSVIKSDWTSLTSWAGGLLR
jgi:hypothetical protein